MFPPLHQQIAHSPVKVGHAHALGLICAEHRIAAVLLPDVLAELP